MTPDNNNYELLERELAVDDPWRLDSNSFEQERYAQMLRISRCNGDAAHALEVGCAAGAFTEMLAPHCQQLTVVDVMPQAIERARQRTKRWSHIRWRTCDIKQFSTAERFDLIVVAEVLYYLTDVAEMHAAIRNLSGMLAPNGALVFGSARDATCRRWGHAAGAETVIALFKESLLEVERLHCHTESVNEDCLLVLFRKSTNSSEQPNLGH
ncbi:SAM-dependent methyltransferase [Bradyrhizobium pachyrhizi]|uniref:nodulation methyltransferase NodS n=1 Tax=Bradyrhizobium pachyrhizi TaxID=280333 RepID=UPI0007050D65|nr:nodulation methyltransferase NodS [Bradyrhizobium pachyrhizi]KRP84831.1 SAM-dependent methyltransferase [Bradyrhizobium pachyrhizi]